MSDDPIAGKWNARYAFSGDAVPPPAAVLSRHADLLPGAEGESGRGAMARPALTVVAPADGSTGGETSGSTGGSMTSTDPGLRALDLACGRAGNGEWLGARGFDVSAWDVSERVVEAIRARPGSRIARAEVRDVVAAPPPADAFDVIVVARFLERALCPAIARALRPGGLLFYQTFTAGLANPDYLLGPNELLDLFPALTVLRYREPEPGPDGRAEAMLVARRDVAGDDERSAQ